jgi:hypothetical protein
MTAMVYAMISRKKAVVMKQCLVGRAGMPAEAPVTMKKLMTAVPT